MRKGWDEVVQYNIKRSGVNFSRALWLVGYQEQQGFGHQHLAEKELLSSLLAVFCRPLINWVKVTFAEPGRGISMPQILEGESCLLNVCKNCY